MKYEPSADVRQGAIAVREMYEALIEVGFNDEQAMQIVLGTIPRMRLP